MIEWASVVSVLNSIGKGFGWVWDRFRGSRGDGPMLKIPRSTLIILDSPYDNQIFWSMGSISDKPAMQVMGRVRATNKTKYSVYPTVKWKKRIRVPTVTVYGLDHQTLGEVIPAAATVELSFTFAIEPPVKRVGETFATRIAVEDQFRKEHWTRRIEFPYRG